MAPKDDNPWNHFTQWDRETIIRLTVNVERMIQDIKGLTDVVDGRLWDHENRIRTMERVVDDFILVRKVVYWMVWIILVSVIWAVITLVLR